MSRKMDGWAPDEQLAAGIRLLLGSQAGFHIGLAGMIEIGQLENLNYWVASRDAQGNLLWEADDLTDLEGAIACFLRLRRERELGYDLEAELAREEADAEVNRT